MFLKEKGKKLYLPLFKFCNFASPKPQKSNYRNLKEKKLNGNFTISDPQTLKRKCEIATSFVIISCSPNPENFDGQGEKKKIEIFSEIIRLLWIQKKERIKF